MDELHDLQPRLIGHLPVVTTETLAVPRPLQQLDRLRPWGGERSGAVPAG